MMVNREEIENKMMGMKQKLAIMEWDAKHDQINPAKRVKYERLCEEFKKLEEELKNAQ